MNDDRNLHINNIYTVETHVKFDHDRHLFVSVSLEVNLSCNQAYRTVILCRILVFAIIRGEGLAGTVSVLRSVPY